MPVGDPLTLTREELYELVWSKPMIELAKDFGISDVAVAKRCRRLGVPVPGRGYWARVVAGQTPRQAPLKKRVDEDADYSALTFDAPREEPTQPKVGTAEHDALRQRIEQLPLNLAVELKSASPAVKRTAVQLKRARRWDVSWQRGEKSGPTIAINVSEAVVDRALILCERLLVGAAALGWTFGPRSSEKEEGRRGPYREPSAVQVPAFGQLTVEGESLAFRIDERRRQVDHVLTDDEKCRIRRKEFVYPPKWDFHPSGELRLHMSDGDSRYTHRTWKDSARHSLEDQVPSILRGLLDRALQIKAIREERRLEAIEQRRREILKLEQSERRRANAELIHALEIQAGSWFRARLLRGYLKALLRRHGKDPIEVKLQGKTVNFVEWAQHYIDQLDPLSETPHHPDLVRDRHDYRTAGEVTEEVGRLVGSSWDKAWKVAAPSVYEGDENEDEDDFDDE